MTERGGPERALRVRTRALPIALIEDLLTEVEISWQNPHSAESLYELEWIHMMSLYSSAIC